MRTLLAVALLVSAVGIPGALAASSASPEDLAQQQDRVEKHLLRVQQERFEAKARGDDKKSQQRLDREFKNTYKRRNAVIDAERNAQ
jgi:Ni/Co efflux regulator RcnB